MNGYLRVYGDVVARRLVAGRPERALVINTPRRQSFNEVLASGIAVLQLDGAFDITQSKWLHIGDRAYDLPAMLTIPGAPDLLADRDRRNPEGPPGRVRGFCLSCRSVRHICARPPPSSPTSRPTAGCA